LLSVALRDSAGIGFGGFTLIALMKDQVDKVRALGLKAAFINSSLDKQEKFSRHSKLERGEYKILYVTPERFRKGEFIKALRANEISLLAIDEAHCISQWGQDFRPEYSRLGEIRAELGHPPVIALTATATPEVQVDICHQLEVSVGEIEVTVSGIERENLAVHVHDLYGLDQKIQHIVALRHSVPGPAIVYFSLISTLEKVSQEISRLNLEHLTYHGQLNAKNRHKQQKLFLEGESELMLATPAFGLGIDKSDIRLVVHAEIPNSLESYYQEIGRAGRDSRASQTHLLFDNEDVSIQMDFIKWSTPEPDFIVKVWQLLKDKPQRVLQEGREFLREQMLFYHKRDFRLETALNMLERWEVIEVNPKNPKDIKVLGEIPEDLLLNTQFESRRKNLNNKLYQLLEWAKMTEGCRMQHIYSYFGVVDSKTCGKCDLCTNSLSL